MVEVLQTCALPLGYRAIDIFHLRSRWNVYARQGFYMLETLGRRVITRIYNRLRRWARHVHKETSPLRGSPPNDNSSRLLVDG